MNKELEEKIIKLGDTIEYVPKTPNYGHAEFVICSVFKRGYIRECYIYPQQQYTSHYNKLIVPDTLRLKSLWLETPCGDPANVWMTFWCKEHKCYSLEFYTPLKSNSFKVECSFGDTLVLNFLNYKGGSQ